MAPVTSALYFLSEKMDDKTKEKTLQILFDLLNYRYRMQDTMTKLGIHKQKLTDDEGYRIGHSEEKKCRARQNVVLELGMFLAALGRERVAILHKGNLELPSDINGLIYIPFETSVQETKNKLAANLQRAGFFINIDSLSAE